MVPQSLRSESFCVFVAVFAALLMPARASLIASEDFSYGEGLSLAGLNGGTGFSSAWTDTGSTAASIRETRSTSGLAYDRISSTGRGLFLQYPPSGATHEVSKVFRSLSVGQSSGIVWIGFLVNVGSVDLDDTFKLTLFNSATPGVNEGISIGKNSGDVHFSLGRFLTTTSASTVVAANTGTHLLVVKYDFAGNAISLFVDPDTMATPSGTPSATVAISSATNQNGFQSLRLESFEASTASSGNGSIDELRFGTTFADVVPEPSSAVLMCGGGLAILLQRRKRCI